MGVSHHALGFVFVRVQRQRLALKSAAASTSWDHCLHFHEVRAGQGQVGRWLNLCGSFSECAEDCGHLRCVCELQCPYCHILGCTPSIFSGMGNRMPWQLWTVTGQLWFQHGDEGCWCWRELKNVKMTNTSFSRGGSFGFHLLWPVAVVLLFPPPCPSLCPAAGTHVSVFSFSTCLRWHQRFDSVYYLSSVFVSWTC